MKHLVLLGGGHAHVHVLKSFAANPPVDAAITLVTPYLRQVYSGMLPGWIAGHYELDDCLIQLKPLADAAGVNIIEAACQAIDFPSNEVLCTSGERIQFDWLSVDTGSATKTISTTAADLNKSSALNKGGIISIRPIEQFITDMRDLKQQVLDRDQAGKSSTIAIIGAGAGGVEVALALQFAWAKQKINITLLSADNTLPGPVAPRIQHALSRAGITLRSGAVAQDVNTEGVVLADNKIIPAHFVIAALGAAAATWPHESGVMCDGGGYILTNDCLQSVSHANVFAVGDCATMRNFSRPKSGVYAVRAGPPLADNLRRVLAGEDLMPYRPQPTSLYLISAGDKHAIGTWGRFSWEGRWVWHWKNYIDRAFIKKYRI